MDGGKRVQFVVYHRPDSATLRLFTFPHGGGGATAHRTFHTGLPETVEVVALALPGRGMLQGEEAFTDWKELVDNVVAMLSAQFDGTPFAFFGHSFGALLAYEVTIALRERGLPLPCCLFLSAHRAANLPSRTGTPEAQTHDLPEEQFLDVVRSWGFVPEEVLADRELLQLILPPLRCDLKLDEQYDGRWKKPLSIPCVVYGGSRDHSVSKDDLNAWRELFEPDTDFSLEMFDGGHFYLVDDEAQLLASISRHLENLSAASAPSVMNGERSTGVVESDLWRLFLEQSARSPDKLALEDGGRSWRYRDVERSARLLGRQLAAMDVHQGDVVGIFLPHSAEYLISLLATLSLGASACLLERNWSDLLLQEFLFTSDTKVTITTPGLYDRLTASFEEKHILKLEQGWEMELRRPEVKLPELPTVRILAEDIAMISMTSGSTGKPKAVLTTQRGCTHCFCARTQIYPYVGEEREGLNVFFAWECLRPLLDGAQAVVIPDDLIFDPPRLLQFIDEKRVTRLTVTTSLLESVLDYPGLAGSLAQRLFRLRIWFLMGEVVPAGVVERAARYFPSGVRLVNAYSTWESLDVAYADLLPLVERGVKSSVAPVGRLLPDCTALILDPEGRPVPWGSPGELHVAGPAIAPGYLKDEAKTAERFIPASAEFRDLIVGAPRIYRTGDRARLLADGQLEILGRIDSTVKIRGFKVSLTAIERNLERVEGISRAIVVPLMDEESAQPKTLAAYLVGDNGRPSGAVLERVRRQARRDLPEYATPGHFIGLETLPVRQGESRKLDLSALPKPQAPSPRPSGIRELSSFEDRLASAWREVLGIEDILPDDNFFSVGGNSLSAARLAGLLAERFGISIPVIDIFQYSTLSEMAKRCGRSDDPAPASAARPSFRTDLRASKIAIIGMAGRFPGANSLEEFWANLLAGCDSLRHFTRQELLEKGLSEEVLNHPTWVSAGQVIDQVDTFDARFWGIGTVEAELMDPQHRIFIETAWAALEQAGYARKNNEYRERTGVFASCGIDGYLVHHLGGGGLKEFLDPGKLFFTEIGNEKDYIATRVAYLMDLGGPAVTVTSACSSALVAVAQATQSLMTGQCDMAVAGASALTFPNLGYCYEEGLVGSEDGHVRPFDERASGTLFGDSVGAVVLKRLDDALQDNDRIWAVISGFGLSNDGHLKAGYTAPSAQAQTRCIVDAIKMAGIGSEQISYVECHATATRVGDAIELKGLYDAFRETRNTQHPAAARCAIGSVKGNIGHANCAAGITGLIKTVLALSHRTLVPTVNYDSLNPKLVEFVEGEDTPFYIHSGVAKWRVADTDTQLPRRAGVSSFGIGGTNAHLIIEEPSAPGDISVEGFQRPHHILTVSAKTKGALTRNLSRLADVVADMEPSALPSAAYTLQCYREAHPLRIAAVVGQEPAAAAETLRALADEMNSATKSVRQASVAFCFSGQGSQYPGMARGLYTSLVDGGGFRRYFDRVCDALSGHLGFNPGSLILEGTQADMKRPIVTQCGLFAVEYALASVLVDLGIKPVAVAGHSIGEYAAAVIAGILSLDDAAKLVAVRSMATEELRGFTSLVGKSTDGGMLSVVGEENAIIEWLGEQNGLWLAVENAPGQVVIAGAAPELSKAEAEMTRLGFHCQPVPVSHPFHSPLMQPVANQLELTAASISLRQPRIPATTNLTGGWLGEEALRPDYWSRHLTSTVRWKDNVATLLRWEPDVILEIGPSDVLARMVAKRLGNGDARSPAIQALAMMRHPKDEVDDAVRFSQTLGRLWCAGVDVDWRAYHKNEVAASGRPLQRVDLPTYAFERDSYWVKPEASIYVDKATAVWPGVEPKIHRAAGSEKPDSVWFVRSGHKRAARVRLYCFPFAGGSSLSFNEWMRAAPDWLDVVGVELPGRNARAEEPMPMAEADDLAALADLAIAIRRDVGGQAFAFCGLSYGAALALELLCGPLKDLQRESRFLGLKVVGRAPVLHDESIPQVACATERFLMVPLELQQNPLWRETFLPLLEADLGCDARAAARIRDRWLAGGKGALLECRVDVHCGFEDTSFPWTDAIAWGAATTKHPADVYYYPGGHDFMLREQTTIRERIWRQLQGRSDGPAPASRPPVLHAVKWTPLKMPLEAIASHFSLELVAGEEQRAVEYLVAMLDSPGASVTVNCRRGARAEKDAQCAGFVDLLQVLIGRQVTGKMILLLPATAESGPLAGVSRVLEQEEVALNVQRVFADDHPDITGSETERTWMDRLGACAMAYPEERDLLYRSGNLSAQRLVAMSPPPLPRGLLGASGGRYLLSGGTGGLGRVLVDWLIDEQGVEKENIVLLGRTPCEQPPRGVRHRVLDLTDSQACRRILPDLGNIEGIFHLAGVLDDAIIQNLDRQRIERVTAPKFALEQLLQFTRQWRTRWVIAYSSTSSLLGAAGQANYAAGNAWMDQLSAWPDDVAVPALVSINWGTWREAGMGARSVNAMQQASAVAEQPLSNDEALAALSSLMNEVLSDGAVNRRFAVCRIDWSKSPWRALPLISGLTTTGEESVEYVAATRPEEPLLDHLSERPESDADGHSDPVREFLGRNVRHWEEDAELAALGFDSLDFVQLRNGFIKQFGAQIPLSAFAAPNRTLGELADHLSAVVGQRQQIN